MRILIVEDEPTLGQQLKSTLEHAMPLLDTAQAPGPNVTGL